MDEAGVAVQVLSISAPNVFRLPAGVRAPLTRDLNDELAAMADGAGGRLRVFANLPLPDVDQSLAELDRVLGRDGMVGVMVCTTIDRRTLDDGLFGPLWEELDRPVGRGVRASDHAVLHRGGARLRPVAGA